jgi:hypothetical protein
MRFPSERHLLEEVQEPPDSPGTSRAAQRHVRPERTRFDPIEKTLREERPLGEGRERRELAHPLLHTRPHDAGSAATREATEPREAELERVTRLEGRGETTDQAVHP